MKGGHAAVLAVCALAAVILADASVRKGTSVVELIDVTEVARLEREAAEADAADDVEATTIKDQQRLLQKADAMYADDIDEPFSVAALGLPQLASVGSGLRLGMLRKHQRYGPVFEDGESSDESKSIDPREFDENQERLGDLEPLDAEDDQNGVREGVYHPFQPLYAPNKETAALSQGVASWCSKGERGGQRAGQREASRE
jgi:hypothetical protein